jgi:type IV secretory pathway VirB2 component (pilin)
MKTVVSELLSSWVAGWRGLSNRATQQPSNLVRMAALVAILLIAQSTFACSVCWGSPKDPMVQSVNKGIYVLLGIVGVVQVGFAALFYSFWRRAREQKRFRESLHVIHRFDEGGPLS